MFNRNSVTLEQYDNATKALYTALTGKEPEADFIKMENDRWFMVTRSVLEAAGLKVP